MGQHAISINGGMGHISLPVRFDISSTAEFRMPFARFLTDAATRKLVVDFSDLEYIDSLGIGMLLAWSKSCRENGKALVLDKCNAKTVRVFKLSGVDGLLEFS